jgi:uncharacterized protein YceK
MGWLPFFSLIVLATILSGCASQTSRVEEMQPYAIRAGQLRGASELDCPAATAQVVASTL